MTQTAKFVPSSGLGSGLPGLDLNSTQLGNQGVAELTRKTSLALKGVVNLNLAFNGLGGGALKSLLKCRSLRGLNLSFNCLGRTGPRKAESFEALGKLPVTELNLKQNWIRDVGAQEVAKNSTVTKLNVANNNIGTSGLVALAQNSTLVELDISYNEFDQTVVDAFAANETLEYLALTRRDAVQFYSSLKRGRRARREAREVQVRAALDLQLPSDLQSLIVGLSKLPTLTVCPRDFSNSWRETVQEMPQA